MNISIFHIICLSLLFIAPAWAEVDSHTVPATKNIAACEDIRHIQVNGLVCDFCARALEKVFGKQDAVAGITVDLDKALVVVTMKPGQIMDKATLTSLITDAGYSVVAIENGC